MDIADLPTPSLILDRAILIRHLETMAAIARRHNVALRPHMKTAKSIDIARLALGANGSENGGITVSTLAEAEYFLSHDVTDILYAVGITPEKLAQVAKLNAAGGSILVVTDDPDMARVIGSHPAPPQTLIEIDTGAHRGGIAPDSPALTTIAERLGYSLWGVMTHGGHSYGARDDAALAAVAEQERAGVTTAALRLREAGYDIGIVSAGSTPSARHARSMEGLTEIRPGVYMFGDLFQSAIGDRNTDDVAVTVLASVIGRKPASAAGPARILLDAGALALSQDRSTAATDRDYGFGLVRDVRGGPSLGETVVQQVWQEHGLALLDPTARLPAIGDKVRITPNHACLTAAAYDRYFVVDNGDEVLAVWPRVNGW